METLRRWRGGIQLSAFVFRDEAFRRYSGLGEPPPGTPVVGFLLDEIASDGRDATAEFYRRGDFRGPLNDTLDELREVVDSLSNSPEPTAEPENPSPTESGQTSVDPDAPVDAGNTWPSPARHRPRFRPGRVRPPGRKPRGISRVRPWVSHSLGLRVFALLGSAVSGEVHMTFGCGRTPRSPRESSLCWGSGAGSP